MRLYTARIPQQVGEKTLEGYLAHAMPLLPQFVIRDAFAHHDVKMDGKRVAADQAPAPGAEVRVYTLWEAELPVVYEDGNVLLINKPAGISCEDDGRGGMTVQSLLAGKAVICHRLDNQTCGLLIAARNAETEAALLQAFRDRTLTKRYECLVKGILRPAAQTATAYILRDESLGRMRVVSHASPEARPIATEYETLEESDGISRLLVTLLTGRTHQIRAHLAALQHPILGDDVYGDRAFNQRRNVRRLMLCSTELTLNAGGVLSYLDGRVFRISAPF